MEIENLAFLVGLVLGSLAIVAVAWVWVRQQVLGAGGAVLSGVGVVLVGLSVWSSASIEATPEGGLRVEFERLQKQVDAVAASTRAIGEEVVAVGENVQTSKAQFVQLTQRLEDRRTIAAPTATTLRQPLTQAPAVKPKALSTKLRRLELHFPRKTP